MRNAFYSRRRCLWYRLIDTTRKMRHVQVYLRRLRNGELSIWDLLLTKFGVFLSYF
uniref:Uncharacterized protein n=1 Tax=Hyaloperonospora arabidopsidis (strain Emoy2) TaxID=559515 RepID=M4B7T5_HYAAE